MSGLGTGCVIYGDFHTLLERPVGFSDTILFHTPLGHFHFRTLASVPWFNSTQNWNIRKEIILEPHTYIMVPTGLLSADLTIQQTLLGKKNKIFNFKLKSEATLV
ncbi:hypothetical protein GOODEAATRI_021846 [Goodea atripinnis]|uniref:Uncharacterized protein n=1 Tax=Goodea atripinnis TaxID=208336 RepID=A0ABV0MU37_9TELE